MLHEQSLKPVEIEDQPATRYCWTQEPQHGDQIEHRFRASEEAEPPATNRQDVDGKVANSDEEENQEEHELGSSARTEIGCRQCHCACFEQRQPREHRGIDLERQIHHGRGAEHHVVGQKRASHSLTSDAELCQSMEYQIPHKDGTNAWNVTEDLLLEDQRRPAGRQKGTTGRMTERMGGQGQRIHQSDYLTATVCEQVDDSEHQSVPRHPGYE
mmetsp:Transcript_31003/g.68082  ORF Transcript_31003/g.68082 Transcript_31003/m.68082 type:complete len:214 (+) Transcript_31003:1892-2533(+)